MRSAFLRLGIPALCALLLLSASCSSEERPGEGEGEGEGEGKAEDELCELVDGGPAGVGQCGGFSHADHGLTLGWLALDSPVAISSVFNAAVEQVMADGGPSPAVQFHVDGQEAGLTATVGWASACATQRLAWVGETDRLVGEFDDAGWVRLSGELILDLPGLGPLALTDVTLETPVDGGQAGTLQGLLRVSDAGLLCLGDGLTRWAEALVDEPTVSCDDDRCWRLDMRFVGAPTIFTSTERPPNPACPAPREQAEIGGEVGQRFPNPNFRGPDGRGHSLYDHCGAKAVLVFSSAAWAEGAEADVRSLAQVATEWEERGGRVYYSLYENAERQPPTDRQLADWQALQGEQPAFPVLKDPNIIKSLYRGIFTDPPFAILLDAQMLVLRARRPLEFDEYRGWMEDVLAQ